MNRHWLADNIMRVAISLYQKEEGGYSDQFLTHIASVLRENIRLIEKEIERNQH